MPFDILVWPGEAGFQATVLGLPVPVIRANTREEAIQQAQHEAQSLLAKSEVVHIENGAEIRQRKTLRDFAEVWANDPQFGELLAAMKAYREESNQEESQAEAKILRIGPGMWKDNPLYDEFVAAMQEARAEIDANPKRL
jgi:hypothetical protein